MKIILGAALALTLAGCATSPHQAVAQLDTHSEKYATAECRAARQVAMTYDDNTGSRVGIGMAAGLLLGPFGIPLAMAMDASQATKRNAVLSEVKLHCEGPIPEGYKAPEGKSDMQLKVEILDDMRAKGMLTTDEYFAKRIKLTE